MYRSLKNLFYVRYYKAWYLVGRTALVLKMRGKLDWQNLACVVQHRCGESCSAIGQYVGLPSAVVRSRLESLGFETEDRRTYGRLPQVCKRGRYRVASGRDGRQHSLHRACWEALYGPIRKGFLVHHIDGNPANNDISNLAAMSPAIHRRVHSSKFGPWRYGG